MAENPTRLESTSGTHSNPRNSPGKRSRVAPRVWTRGQSVWFALSILAAIPAWISIYFHQQWSDNSIFELINHTHWHLALGMIVLLGLDAYLRWWFRWRPPRFTRTVQTLLLILPTSYLLWDTEPWTAIPLAKIAPNSTGKNLRLLSWNLYLRNDRFEEILGTIREVDADVVVLMELTPEHQKGLEELSRDYAAYRWYPKTNTQGFAVFSKIPGTKFKTLDLGMLPIPAVEVFLPSGDDRVGDLRLLGVHTSSPNLDGRFRFREDQLKEVAKWVRQSELDSIVIGDLNTTPWSPDFRDLIQQSGLIDSRRYRGYFASWPTGLGIVGIPIDHALVTPGLRVTDRKVGFPSVASDHQWIDVTIEKRR